MENICAGCGKEIKSSQSYRYEKGEYWHVTDEKDCQFPERQSKINRHRVSLDTNLDCRGRNGWFTPKTLEIYARCLYEDSETSYVSIFSKQTYGQAPIRITGPHDEVVALFRQILSKLEEREE